MNKIKNWIIGHKKTSIAIGIATVFLIAIGSIVLTFNARQVADSRKQVETAEAKQKEEALAKKIDEAKKVLDEKVENLDKLSSEDKNKLETAKKQLAEAIKKKDELNIVKLQNELRSALNTAKTNVEKIVAEEKLKAEEVKKEEEKKAEDNKPAENTTASNATASQPTKKPVDTGATAPAQQAEESKPVPTPQPQPEAPKPAPEKPKGKKRIGQLGNSGLEFKTYEEARSYGNKILNSTGDDWLEWNKKMGFQVGGWSGWTVDYSDGTQTWTINWKP